MNKKFNLIVCAAAALSLSLAACGGGDSGGGGGGTSDFSNATSATVTGVNTAADFATSGAFTVGFVAADASGNPILASNSASAQVVKTAMYGKWLNTTVKDSGATGLTCSITDPASSTCTLGTITSTQPSGGSGTVEGSALIDDSGSMSWNDPTNSRGPAAHAFLDSACSSATNIFGIFDFGYDYPPGGGNAGFTVTRDLMTANGITNADLDGAKTAIPYEECTTGNVATGKTAITNQLVASGGTPLYDSVLELCNDMVAKHAAGGQLDGYALSMLILSDGSPNGDVDAATAESCLSTNGIIACTVGLGEGSELDPAANTDAINALKSLAAAGSCVYAAATDAAALTPIFTAIGTAVSTGQNFASYAISPVPASGTTVNGTLTVGTATATFSFIAP